MNVSTLIDKLQSFLKEHGDIPVVLYDDEGSRFYELGEIVASNESFTATKDGMMETNPDKQPVCVLWS